MRLRATPQNTFQDWGFDASTLEEQLVMIPGKGAQWSLFLREYSGFTQAWKDYLKLPHVKPVDTLQRVLSAGLPLSTKLSVTFKGFMTPLKRMSLCKEYTISEKDLEDAYGRGTGPSPKSLKQLAGTIGSERFRKMKRNSRILFGSQMLLAGTERNLIWQRVSVM